MDKELFQDTLNNPAIPRRMKLFLCLFIANKPQSVTQIKALAVEAGVREIAGWNVTDILNKARGLAVRLPDGWILTSRGRALVESSFPGAPPPAIIAALRVLLPAIKSDDTKDFVAEAIKAYEASLFRSAIVLSWVGAVSLLYDYVIANELTAFNAEATRRDPAWKKAKTKDDLALMKESAFLDIIAAISVIGKNVKEHLKNVCLGLRNSAGHPNSMVFGKAQVEAHLEHLVLNIYQKF